MNEDEQSRIELYLKFQNNVLSALSNAEVAVLRELVMELLKDNQRLADRATDSYVNQQIYDRVNSQFAGLADDNPEIATMYAKILEQWKTSHGIM